MCLLSFVIPCYRSEKTIELVIDELKKTVKERPEYDYEIIAVNDNSPDLVYEVLKRLAQKDHKIKIVNLARNMGKHSAVMAGYSYAKGDYIVNLDDDYQSPAYELWKLIELLENQACDVATAVYYQKKEKFYKRFGSDINLWMTRILLDKPEDIRMENFSAMRKYVCDEIIKYKNPYPYLEGLILRVTKNVSSVPMEQRDRADENPSGFTLKKSLSLFINGLTAFSVKPLRISSLLGITFAIVGFLFGVSIIIKKIVDPSIAIGYSSIMAIILFSSGLTMLLLGLIGEYLGRIYICINESPQYVIKNTINVEGK